MFPLPPLLAHIYPLPYTAHRTEIFETPRSAPNGVSIRHARAVEDSPQVSGFCPKGWRKARAKLVFRSIPSSRGSKGSRSLGANLQGDGLDAFEERAAVEPPPPFGGVGVYLGDAPFALAPRDAHPIRAVDVARR